MKTSPISLAAEVISVLSEDCRLIVCPARAAAKPYVTTMFFFALQTKHKNLGKYAWKSPDEDRKR